MAALILMKRSHLIRYHIYCSKYKAVQRNLRHNCKVGVSNDKMFFLSEGSMKGPATKHINRRFSLSDLDGGGGEGLARLLGAAGVTIAEPCKDEFLIMANKSFALTRITLK